MIFEGEYLNGKRHGKGKEYNYSDKIIYEGDFLDGEKNGDSLSKQKKIKRGKRKKRKARKR